MPRPSKSVTNELILTAALEGLVLQKQRIDEQIADIRSRLGKRGGNAGAARPAAGRKRGRRRRSSLSPEQLASRQLQGRYLGLIRQIPASRRGQYQKIAKESGREAAIKAMQETLKK